MQRSGLHPGDAEPFAPLPHGVPYIGHLALDAWFVLWFQGSCWIDETAVVLGELSIGAVQERVVDVRLDHAGLQIVTDEPGRHRPEELEGGHVARRPGALVHDEHRAHEHVTAEGKHNDEGPDPAHPLANGVEPLAEIAVVDLGLFARRDVRARRRRDIAQVLLGELPPEVSAKARDAHTESVLVAQALMHGGGRVGREHLGDELTVHLDGVVGATSHLRVDQLGKPTPHECPPLLDGDDPVTGRVALGLGMGDVFVDGAAVYPEAPRDLGLLPACVPVHEHLDDVNHCKGSPCHLRLSSRWTRGRLVDQGAQVVDPRPRKCGIT